jgi:AcrR family transcriptional regulator
MSSPRPYRKKKRARSEEETRQRIIEAAVATHEAKGAASSLTEIARLAGVGRVTLYRHFPDEVALISACTSHYLALHPLPDLETWQAIADPHERLVQGLRDTFAFHRETVQMMTQSEHAVALSPVLAELLEPMIAYWNAAADILAQGWSDGETVPRFVREMIGLALALPTWRLMTQEQGLSDAACVDLFVDAIGCLSRKSEA